MSDCIKLESEKEFEKGGCVDFKSENKKHVCSEGKGRAYAHDGEKHKLTAAVITVSDKGYSGQREDLGGPLTAEIAKNHGYDVVYKIIVPDEQSMIEAALIKCADELKIDLVLTTGGTGFSLRDVTPEATVSVCDRMAPGIAEAMRMESYKITKKAMLSRAASGIRKQTLIVNLPGSPKAVRENLEAVLPALAHGIEILRGDAGECGSMPSQK